MLQYPAGYLSSRLTEDCITSSLVYRVSQNNAHVCILLGELRAQYKSFNIIVFIQQHITNITTAGLKF